MNHQLNETIHTRPNKTKQIHQRDYDVNDDDDDIERKEDIIKCTNEESKANDKKPNRFRYYDMICSCSSNKLRQF